MTPPIATVATTPALLSHPAPITAQKPQASATTTRADWKNRTRLTSPDIQAPAAIKVAQSELPGGSTPPPAPSSPNTTVDTGNGYTSRIPRSYLGPAFATGNGSGSFGAISRFPLSPNYSIRPSAIFGGSATIVRVPITYDFIFSDKEPFERNPVVTFNVGGGVQYSSVNNQSSKFSLLATVGVDVNLFEGVALVSSYNTDFGSINGVNFGLGFEF
ncbi:hypothetical protein [Chamaesiphon sp. GL140_3_metabinner_50]|uniref:hypothetical protein n=1 Tax=Chamaesiphon sp. GL140_3_metabinner_50 TaxID=2970812 RepID=UPI0025CD7DF5|nr:hypothetical protein [Chamaesiphon sp. GL140_3_metabinner_50]